jgi:FtsZ-binding cell division protein ZapB
VTDHLGQAAARAIELAAALTTGVTDFPGDGAIAAHLTYLAGLIRGGAAQPTAEATVPGWDGKFWVGGIQFDDPSETDAEDLEPSETVAAMRLHIDQLSEERDSYRKRWHEAATQRDRLVLAAREALDNPRDQFGERDGLRAAVEQVEANDPVVGAAAHRLRRELWAVLDRMPASADDLIASVRDLVEHRDVVSERRQKLVAELRVARAERDELREIARQIQQDRIDTLVAVNTASPIRPGPSSVSPELLDRLAELAKP